MLQPGSFWWMEVCDWNHIRIWWIVVMLLLHINDPHSVSGFWTASSSHSCSLLLIWDPVHDKIMYQCTIDPWVRRYIMSHIYIYKCKVFQRICICIYGLLSTFTFAYTYLIHCLENYILIIHSLHSVYDISYYSQSTPMHLNKHNQAIREICVFKCFQLITNQHLS